MAVPPADGARPPRARAQPDAPAPVAAPLTLEGALRALLRDEVRRVLRDELGALVAQVAPQRTSPEEYLSVKRAATIAGVSQGTVRGWIRTGRLPEHRAGRLVRVRHADLVALLARGRRERVPTVDEQAERILARRRA
jgi:excisionase family DNA binding protein